jgi:hypothetical protein
MRAASGSRDRTLRKTEYSRTRVETFGDFHLKFGKAGAQRRKRKRKMPGFPAHSYVSWEVGQTREWVTVAGGFEPGYGELQSDALACPRGAAEPLFVEIQSRFETLEFRGPFRIRGVPSVGDIWAFRRINERALLRRSPEIK